MMYFDAAPDQYTGGVASPWWPQDVVSASSWNAAMAGHAMVAMNSWHNGYHDAYSSYGYGSYDMIDQSSQAHNALEAFPAEPEAILVVKSMSSGSCASLCADAASADCVAFDTEWAPDQYYGSDNPISVMQLAFPASRRVYVLQLGSLSGRLPPSVQMMLVNPEVTKVGFAVDNKDAEKLRRSGIAVTSSSVVDLQERCALAMGISSNAKSLSLKQATQSLLGFNLKKDKQLTCSDWASTELTPEQVQYAALDAWVTLRLFYHTG